MIMTQGQCFLPLFPSPQVGIKPMTVTDLICLIRSKAKSKSKPKPKPKPKRQMPTYYTQADLDNNLSFAYYLF